MSLSRTAAACRACPFEDQCENKRMEALGCLRFQVASAASESGLEQLAAPVLRETVTIRTGGTERTVYRDEIERELYGHLYKGLGLQFGG